MVKLGCAVRGVYHEADRLSRDTAQTSIRATNIYTSNTLYYDTAEGSAWVWCDVTVIEANCALCLVLTCRLLSPPLMSACSNLGKVALGTPNLVVSLL